MNRDQAKALLPIITAFAEGKTVQIRHSLSGAWWTREDYSFEGLLSHYRIKPEPRKMYLVRNCRGHSSSVPLDADPEKYVADINKHGSRYALKPYTLEEYVEVIK